jgi:hypothetical protein
MEEEGTLFHTHFGLCLEIDEVSSVQLDSSSPGCYRHDTMGWQGRRCANMEGFTTPSSKCSEKAELIEFETEASLAFLRTVRTAVLAIDLNIVESKINCIHVVLIGLILDHATHTLSVINHSHSCHNASLAVWIHECTVVVAFVAFEIRVLRAIWLIRSILHH